MKNKLTQQQLDQLTIEANEFMAEPGRKRFPPAKADELREMGAKRCSRCKEVKNLEAFGKESRSRDGLLGRCKPCDSAGSIEYYHRNTDKVLEYKREHHATNRDRLNEYRREYHRTQRATDEIYRLQRQLNSGYHRAVQADNEADWITAEQLLTYWSARGIDPLVCYLTGESLTPFDRSIDHVVAIGNGGSHTVDNLMPCTLEANLRKHNLDPDDAKEKLNID